MKMIKRVRKIGNSLGLLFNKEECKNSKIKKDSLLDLSDVHVIEEKRED